MNEFVSEPREPQQEIAAQSVQPTFDVAELRARCLGNEPLMRKILGKLESVLRHEYSQAEEAWQRLGFQSLATTAHRLKGTAANVGAEALSLLALEVEKAAKRNREEGLRELVTQLERGFESLRGVLVTLIREGARSFEGVMGKES